MKTIKQLLALAWAQGIGVLFPLLATPYLVSKLGVERFGEYSYSMALASYLYVVIEYGFDLTAVSQISKRRGSKRYLNYKYNVIQQSKICLAAVALLLVLCLAVINAIRVDLYLLSALAVYAVFQALMPNWFFRVTSKYREIAVSASITKILTIILMLLLVNKEDDIVNSGLAIMLPMIFSSCIFNFWAIRDLDIRFGFVGIRRIYNELKYGKFVFLSQVNSMVYSSGNVVITANILGLSAVGYYVLADKIVRAVALMVTPISTWLYPIVAAGIKKEFKKIALKILKITIFVTLFEVILLLIIYIGLDWICLNFLKVDSTVLTPLFGVLSPVAIILFINNMLGIQIMLNLDMHKQYFLILLFGATMSMISSYIMAQMYQTIGVALVSLITELSVVLVFGIVLRKHFKFGS